LVVFVVDPYVMPDHGLSIKKCTVKEIPLIVEVALQSYVEHYTYLWTDGGNPIWSAILAPTLLKMN
jgi:hypothetical protein